MKRALVVILLVALAGCATTSSTPFWVKTWEGAVDYRVVTVTSAPWPGVQGWVACDKARRYCDVIISEQAMDPDCTLRHELKHVAGFDHPNYRHSFDCGGWAATSVLRLF